MAKHPDPEVVSALSAVTEFSADDNERLAAAGTLVNIPESWSLILESTPADKAYIILEGEVSIRHAGEEIAQLGPGAIIGEMAVVGHKLRSASVVSLSPIKALHFTDDALIEAADAIPAFGDAVRSSAAKRAATD